MNSIENKGFEAVFNSMNYGIVIHNSTGRFNYYNKAAFELLGISEPQFCQKEALDTNWKLIQEDGSEIQRSRVFVLPIIPKGARQENYIVGVQNNGDTTRWISISTKPLHPKVTDADQFVTSYHDVTELKKSKDQVHAFSVDSEKTRKFLRATLNTIPALVSYIDKNLHYRYVNASYEKWFNLSASECVGKSMIAVLGHEAVEKLRPRIDKVLFGQRQDFEAELPYKVVGLRHVQVTYIPDISELDTVEGFYVVVQDVTPQVQAKLIIQQKEEELSRIMDSLPALIGYWDSNQCNIHANKAYLEYFGWAHTKMKGVHIREVLGEVLYEKNKSYIEAVLCGYAQTFEREIPLPNGEKRFTLAQYLPDTVDGKVQGFFAIVTDISPIKKLETERRLIEAKLVEASKMSALGEMASGIAHEINNPLTIIQGKALRIKKEAEQQSPDHKTMIDSADKIHQTVKRISKIINSLRSFAKDSSHEPFEMNSIKKILNDTLEFCYERFKQHEIELIIENGDLDTEIECRAHQISQVLLNLLNNAHDAVEHLKVRWIRVHIHETSSDLFIRISDSGDPIPEAVREKLFQPFFSTKEIGKGTGLGLSLSKGIIEEHRGHLELLKVATPTCFEMRLPKKYKKP